MKTYIADIIPKIKKYSKELDNLTLLLNQHWVTIDESTQTKQVLIFRKHGELLIALDGRVKRGKWEYLDNESILIEKEDEMFLFRHGFLDEDIFALKLDSRDEFAFFVNESNYGSELNSVVKINSFLLDKYVNQVRETAVAPEQQKNIEPPREKEDRLKKKNHTPVELHPPFDSTELDSIYYKLQKLTVKKIRFSDGIVGLLFVYYNGESFFEAEKQSDEIFQVRYWVKNEKDGVIALYHLRKKLDFPTGKEIRTENTLLPFSKNYEKHLRKN